MPIVRVVLLGWLLVLLTPPLTAGTMSVRWSPVTGATSYRIYWGTAARQYTQAASVTATSATLTVADNTTWYVGVKAVSSGGLESSIYSNEVAGVARPTVNTVTPNHGAVGQRMTVTITGTNFRSGMTVAFLNPGIIVHSQAVTSSTSCAADITLVGPAASGIGIEVLRQDRVFGLRQGLFTIDAAPNAAAPTVTSARPVAGALGVLSTVTATVRFSEPLARTTVSGSTVRLLNEAGSVVAQAAGFPSVSLDATAVSIKPAVPLQAGKTYRIQVVGGTGGAKDTTNVAVASTWTQSPGFKIALQDSTTPRVASATPFAGATGVSTLIMPRVTFSEPMLLSSILPTNVRILRSDGGVVPQATGYPVLSADGMTATIKPASALPAGATFRIQVQGGTLGVKDLGGNTMPGDWSQSSQWMTGSTAASTDVEGPVVSSVSTTIVGSTSVQLGWRTDEVASSQVLYRPEDETDYLETPVDESLEREHRLTVSGLLPEKRYAFLVRSGDRAGNVSVSSPDQEVATEFNAFRYVTVEAEAGELTGGISSGDGQGSSRGRWIEMPAHLLPGPSAEPTAAARYTMTVPDHGNWYLWLRVRALPGSAGWAIAVNGGAWSPVPTPAHGGWTWVRTPAGKLGPGQHVIDVGALGPGSMVDQLVLTDDPAFGAEERRGGPSERRVRQRGEGARSR